MADDINKKISIDVQVNSDGQQQIDQYKASFDSLRSAISGLGKPLTDLSKNISSLNTDLEKLASVNEKIATKMTDNAKKATGTLNQNLKAGLAQAEKIRTDSLIRQLQAAKNFYQAASASEDQRYGAEESKLDDLLSKKLISRTEYNRAEEQLLTEHEVNIRNIIQQYIGNELKASSAKIAMPEPQLPDQTQVKQIDLMSGLQQQFTDIAQKGEEKRSAISVSSTLKTVGKLLGINRILDNAITGSAKKSADDQRKNELDNAQKISDSVFTIITKGIDERSSAEVAGMETRRKAIDQDSTKTAAEKKQQENFIYRDEYNVKLKAFKQEQKINIAQAIMNGALAITKSEAELGPIAGTIALGTIIAQTAAQIATIKAQQPPVLQTAEKGGYFASDGKGAVLPGYSRKDNINAHIRSGEAVVVSEAMRDPWARNLVSAINVAYGGRDFSVPNLSRGYAVGGIFTDGGNANRYYNQPMNDNKNLANTIAYQMINNFPPVYVDVKDINNQQNILAQTINRVNL
ncbi:MAG TPA: hypothetical protein VHE59_18215 [Mucilaginibacter sp.]|nr:hypothetical protein [Mucilaginibacter sp.]